MNQAYVTKTTCRVCGGNHLRPIYNLGNQYVNDFPYPQDCRSGPQIPIMLDQCPHCTLIQARNTPPQDLLYKKFYWYRSGVTETMRNALANIADTAMPWVSAGDLVLDIGSNDGTLLRSYPSHIAKVGFEPAENLKEEGQTGVDFFISDFWSAKRYWEYVKKPAKVVTAIGMFYDLDDPNQFIADIAEVLDKDGLFIAQLMCMRNMVRLQDVGNFAHEHLEYYTLDSLDVLLNRHGLWLEGLETNSVNGESYRLFIRRQDGNCHVPEELRQNLKSARIAECEMWDASYYDNFFAKMEENKRKVVSFICSETKVGKRVWIYGASTKGNVILQYYGLDRSLIGGAADRSPEKWGRVTVGTGIPIHSELTARIENPDYFLVLPYAFINEFLEREREWHRNGGKFIVPLPEFKVI